MIKPSKTVISKHLFKLSQFILAGATSQYLLPSVVVLLAHGWSTGNSYAVTHLTRGLFSLESGIAYGILVWLVSGFVVAQRRLGGSADEN